MLWRPVRRICLWNLGLILKGFWHKHTFETYFHFILSCSWTLFWSRCSLRWLVMTRDSFWLRCSLWGYVLIKKINLYLHNYTVYPIYSTPQSFLPYFILFHHHILHRKITVLSSFPSHSYTDDVKRKK